MHREWPHSHTHTHTHSHTHIHTHRSSTHTVHPHAAWFQADPQPWWAENQPCFVAGKTDPNYGKCLGWSDHPAAVLCSGSYDTVQRLCRCDAPSSSLKTFGTVESSASIGPAEKEVFSWVLSGEQTGAMTHFWITYSSATDPSTMIRYYVDGETTASIAFTPSMAAGTGFYDRKRRGVGVAVAIVAISMGDDGEGRSGVSRHSGVMRACVHDNVQQRHRGVRSTLAKAQKTGRGFGTSACKCLTSRDCLSMP